MKIEKNIIYLVSEVNRCKNILLCEIKNKYPLFYHYGTTECNYDTADDIVFRMQGNLESYLNPEKYNLPKITEFTCSDGDSYRYESKLCHIVLCVNQKERE